MSKLLSKPTPTVNDLAKKYGVSVLEVKKQLMKGMKVEKEHTNDPKIAREIALDHLGEKLNYYTLLAKIEEETLTGDVRGLGYVSGDPAGTNFVQQYIDTNAMSYEDENGNKLDFIKKQHVNLHNNGLGYSFFDPTKVKSSSNFMNEQAVGLSQYSKLNELGGMTGYEGLSDSRSARKDVQVDEGEKLKKAKRVAMAGLTAANIYTMGDVMSKASSGRGSPKGDVVRMASTLPGAAGWGATGVHYAKKAYDYVKGKKTMKEDKDPCRKGYEMVGMKKKGAKNVPNCVPVQEQGPVMSRYNERPTYEENKYPETAERGIYETIKSSTSHKVVHRDSKKIIAQGTKKEMMKRMKALNAKNPGSHFLGNAPSKKVGDIFSEDWQSVNRKDKTDGLSQKAVNAYKRENPGSKLQTAVTEKNPTGKRASRRKSFCSRMGGMKKRLTSAKTARDPDSRINKALRRWNCEEFVMNEMDTSMMRPSTNIDDRRGLMGSIKGAMNVYTDKYKRQGYSGTQAAGSAAVDTAKTVGQTAVKSISNAINDRLAPKLPQSWTGSKPSSGLSPAEKEPISSPTGASPPTIDRGTTTPQGSFANQMDAMDMTPSKSAPKVTPRNSPQSDIGDIVNRIDTDTKTRTPSNYTKNVVNEISAELVGKISNARWQRGEVPSKTLTRAINKKFVESGKKLPEQPPFTGSHKRSHEKSSTHVHKLALKGMRSVKEEGSQDKDWDETRTPFREQADLNKQDVKLQQASYTGAGGTQHTVHEETKMDNKLINEAIENIMEDNLGAMKENLMVALQEKAIEKLEERKKEIAAQYFAQ